MGKFVLRFLVLLLVIFFSIIIYLSYFGIETDKFDVLIKEKVNKINKKWKKENLIPEHLELLNL